MERQTLNSGRESSLCKINLSPNNKHGILGYQAHFCLRPTEDLVLQSDFLFGRDAEQTLVEITEGGQPGKDQRKTSSTRFSSLAGTTLCSRSVTEQALTDIMTKISIMQETQIKLSLACWSSILDI